MGSSTVLYQVFYYDDLGRTTRSYVQHYLGGTTGLANAANYDTFDHTYNFNNQLTGTVRNHYTTANLTAAAVTVGTAYYYDHMGRKKQTWEAVTVGGNPSPPSLLLSQLDYNEIGQVLTKHLHSENNGSSFLQDIGYTYNERGWLRTSGTSANGVSTNLLHIDLRYNSADAATQQFNGNIAEMHYTGPTSGTKVFGYTYDPLNRLTIAASTGGTLDERIAYDNLGNITGLIRGGVPYGALTYTYENGNQSNRLSSVTGAGFTTRNYSYDFNGNATSDGGSNLAYNLLNLPQSLTSGGSTVATYTYDATGNKLRSSGALGGTWDYISGINYKSGSIDNITTEEGRVVYNSGNPKYEYDLKDHLGNVRVSFDKSPTTNVAEVVQEDEYYAFGLRHGLVDNSNDNRYLYNGKEYQKDLKDQYDYGARFYDPVIGRWTSVDPLAEKDRRWTPYGYGFDNSIRFMDPDGMWPDWLDNAVNKVKTTATAAVTAVKEVASKYTIKADFKASVGLQGGVETPLGEAKVNVASVVLSKDNVTLKNGQLTHSGEKLNTKVGTNGESTNTHSVEIESSAGIGMASTGVEAGQSFKVTGSDAHLDPGTQTSYHKGALLGAENKTTTNADGSKPVEKSQNYTFGLGFILGFQLDINIKKNN